MALEIERKFLLKDSFEVADIKQLASHCFPIKQAYLNSDPKRTVRIRQKGDEAFLTIKGISTEDGLSRYEWEKTIALEEFEELLHLAEPGAIEKERFLIPVGDHNYEVDVFTGANKGLIIAEVELSAEDESFIKPDWLAEEVTGDKRFYNSQLSQTPYASW